MAEKKIPISGASDAELRKFAADYLGINIGGNSKRETILAKLKAAWSKDHVIVAVEDEPAKQEGAPPQPVTAKQQPPDSAKDPKVRIVIPTQDTPGGSEPVPLGVNGRIMVVERDKESDIPLRYYEVLKNATQNIYDPLPDGKGINPVPRVVPLYPHNVIHDPAA